MAESGNRAVGGAMAVCFGRAPTFSFTLLGTHRPSGLWTRRRSSDARTTPRAGHGSRPHADAASTNHYDCDCWLARTRISPLRHSANRRPRIQKPLYQRLSKEMAEPWLDSLSEDWNSQPTSSPGSLPSFGTPSASARSRIPRYSHKSPKNASMSLRRPKSASSTGMRVLQERSVSDTNIFSYSSSRAAPPKSLLPAIKSTSSSVGSAGSVVKWGSVARKSRSHSPAKSNDTADPPEWRKLVLDSANGHMAQPDLFNQRPLGLQNIFEKPPDTPTDDEAKPSPSFSFMQGFDSMPSSPPPWPKAHRGSSLVFAGTSIRRDHEGLDSILELREDEVDNSLDEDVDVGNQSAEESEGDEGDEVDEVKGDGDVDRDVEDQRSGPVGHQQSPPLKWNDQGDGKLHVSSPRDDERVSNHSADISDDEEKSPGVQEGFGRGSKARQSVQSSSSTTSGFSPVFISKHNTVDGRVDYTAVDTSNPQTQELLRSLATTITGQGRQGAQSRELSTALPAPMQIPQSRHTSGVPQQALGNFVSIERGGYSDDNSFKRRPLSPSPSSSIVPSDSVSQVHEAHQAVYQLPTLQVDGNSSPDLTARNGVVATLIKSSTTLVEDPDAADMRPFLNTLPDSVMRYADLASSENRESHRGDETRSADGSADIDGCQASEPAERVESSGSDSGTAPSVETVLQRSRPESLSRPPPMPGHDHRRPLTPQPGISQDAKDDACKRSPASSAKGPTPKRRRTLGQMDSEQATEHVSEVVKEQHRRLQAMIGKRKDARYENDYAFCDPETLAKRDILRPRQLSTENLSAPAVQDDAPGASLGEALASDQNLDNSVAVRGLALKAATVRINAMRGSNDLFRKPSVSTKDYLDEALKIMDLIRLKRQPSEPSSFDEAGDTEPQILAEHMIRDFTPQSISRPPSREGSASGWRSRDGRPLNPRVVSHLQKYQETQDETFLISSVLEMGEEEIRVEEEDDSIRDHEPVQIRIFPPLHEQEQPQSPVKTHSSQESTDSGRTMQTTLSQRSRVPTIAPDQVSHLLHEETNGMRFDTKRNTWVKARKRGPSINISSSTGTEDDPFLHIPDLSINESNGERSPGARDQSDMSDLADADDTVNHYDRCETSDTLKDSDESPNLDELLLDPLSSFMVPRPADDEVKMEVSSPIDEEGEMHDVEPPSAFETPNRSKVSKAPSDTVRSKRRDNLDMHSSPRGHSNSVLNYGEMNDFSCSETSLFDHEDKGLSSPPSQSLFTDRRNISRPRNAQEFTFQHTSAHERSSRFYKQREISLIKTRPDGRTMSLTLSVSTPLPALRRQTRHVLPSSAAIESGLWQSMSPLSDFTLHQDDARHLQNRDLVELSTEQRITAVALKIPEVVKYLVGKITDAESDKQDWDFMQSLVLAGKGLGNLHMLDEFCPMVDNLDVSNNHLKHLDGAPSRTRHLQAAQNELSSVTTWIHLTNLQYLDISGNDIETLSGLSRLVHLRELRADNNNIVDIEGLYDLDGLLSLSLNGNQLRSIDFTGAVLVRLETLSVQHNSLHAIQGLHYLRALKRLDLSNNLLATFPNNQTSVGRCPQIRSLCLANNSITTLDVSLFPRLEYLDVDSNYLSQIINLACLENIHTLCMRSQTTSKESANSITDFLPHCSELTNLYLSSNPLSDLTCSLSSTDRFQNLQVLEIALCSLSSLPPHFATTFPNLRSVNLNFNALKDIRPLRGIRKLRKLYLAGNRVSRLRRTISVLATLSRSLDEVDLRDNLLVNGFYPPVGFGVSMLDVVHNLTDKPEQDSDEWWDEQRTRKGMQILLPPSNTSAPDEKLYIDRLDEETKLRRRVYGLMLAAKAPGLKIVDGREWRRDSVVRRDVLWEKLVGMGVVEIVDTYGGAAEKQ